MQIVVLRNGFFLPERQHKRDDLIEFLKSTLLTPFVLHAKPRDVSDDDQRSELKKARSRQNFVDDNLKRYADTLLNVETLLNEHITMQNKGAPHHSRLKRLVPTVGTFFTPLPLREAFLITNERYSISARRSVPPSFNDVRRILNTAQVLAIAHQVKLITFDGDMTLYADGADFAHDSVLVAKIVSLLNHGIQIAVVTAAGYAGDPTRYEQRLSGLLAGFLKAGLSKDQVEKFWVLGGECNFLFQASLVGETGSATEDEGIAGQGVSADAGPTLSGVAGKDMALPNRERRKVRLLSRQGQSDEVRSWTDQEVSRVLDCAEKNLRMCVEEMGLDATIIRKVRAVGMMPNPGIKFGREQLDECVLSTKQKLEELPDTPEVRRIPYCAFNGGSDVWVDIGNKLIGVRSLQGFFDAKPSETLHVGDQFLSTGNDHATRAACCTVWVINPEETVEILTELDLQFQSGLQPTGSLA